MSGIQLVVVTPEATVLDEPCQFVAVPMIDGEAGILPGHAPMIGRLQPGELRVRGDGKEQSFYVDGGFVQVNSNVVSVLTNTSKPVGQLDVAAAEEALSTAKAMSSETPELADMKDRAVAQARAQIRLASKA